MIESIVLSLINDRRIRKTQNNKWFCANDTTPYRVVYWAIHEIFRLIFAPWFKVISNAVYQEKSELRSCNTQYTVKSPNLNLRSSPDM